MQRPASRYLTAPIQKDLQRRMVFIGGPRQVGKTTLAQSFLKQYRDGHPAYLNYDFPDHKFRILNREWPAREKIIIFDEVHKMRGWRNLLKGYFDILKNSHRFLVTGSARLDLFSKGGDSLLGRYRYYRLHPFSLTEMGISRKNAMALFEFGGFPEPLFGKDAGDLRRWHRERLHRIIATDVRDLERIFDIEKVFLLAAELPRRVGSPLSVKALAEDLQVDFKTMERWISILENMYYCYRILPYGSPKIRAVKKERKLYLWDWSPIENPGIRFENMVAGHLLKYCHYLEDTQGFDMELRYLRDTDGRETDFVVLRDKKPLFAVECKFAETNLSPHVQYFAERTPVPVFYQVHFNAAGERQISDRIKILPFEEFVKITRLV